jgi:hypothetical protein
MLCFMYVCYLYKVYDAQYLFGSLYLLCAVHGLQSELLNVDE